MEDVLEKYLKTKDCAKILYNLYKNYFDRLANKAIFVPMEITPKQEEEFQKYALMPEEIWAYSNGVIDLPHCDLAIKREESFEKELFLNAIISPLIKVFSPKDKQFTVEEFILENHLCDDAKLLSKRRKCITVIEAKKMVENVIYFLEN